MSNLVESEAPVTDENPNLAVQNGSHGSQSFWQLTSHLRPSVILAFLLLLHVGWVVWDSAIKMPTMDFFTFWIVAHSIPQKPIPNIYSFEGQRELAAFAVSEASAPKASDSQKQATAMVTQAYAGRIDTTGTPLLYAAVGWLSSGNFDTDKRRFVFLCTLCLALSLAVLARILRFSFVEIVLLIALISSYYVPVLTDMQVGNVNEELLLAVALFIYFTIRAQPLLAGLVIGTATMLKPMPILVLVLSVVAYLVDREYRQLLRMLVGCFIAAAASFLASAAYFGTGGVWLEFLRSLPKTLGGTPYPLERGNFSFPILLFGGTQAYSAVIPLALLGAFSWLLFTTRQSAPHLLSAQAEPSRRTHTAIVVAGAGYAIILLSSSLAWAHYFLLLLPLSLYLMRPPSENNETSRAHGSPIWRAAAWVAPFVFFLMFSFLAQIAASHSPSRIRIVFLVATFSTLALASYQLWRQRRVPEAIA